MVAQFYLKQLIIQNFATFKSQTIHFRSGLNVIVGETGSGKSLVLDALQLILGGRADRKVIRRETEHALVEASFFCSDPSMKSFFAQEGYPLEDSELIIKRVILRNGSTKNYVNHLSCTVSFLSQFARKYIDIVGQFDNQKLLSESYQLHLLDQFGKMTLQLSNYQDLLAEYKILISKKDQLESSKTNRDQRLDYLNFQLEEIERLNPSSQDEEDLLKKKNLILNIEKNQKLSYQVNEIFEGREGQEGLSHLLQSLSSILRRSPEQFHHHFEVLIEIEDKVRQLQTSLEHELNQEIDVGGLETVLDRLDLYHRLKKKFGGNVEGILQAHVEFLKEKTQLEELEISLEDSHQKIHQLQKKLYAIADTLHQNRKNLAIKLGENLSYKIRKLKMSGATIKVEVDKVPELLETGATKVSFLAETNKGEGFFKIKDIASGGELSRILLGVRQILSAYDSISIFLFDEIDTGIGGETANCIGKALSEVANQGQVVAITHLPQIAQFADELIVVEKSMNDEQDEVRTESFVKEVIGKAIMKEVNKMTQLH